MRLLVTGGAGFIGSHLVDRLLERGDAVVCVDNFDPFYDPRIKWRNLHHALGHAHFELLVGDLCDPTVVARAMERGPFDCVVHLAARAGVRPSIAHPALYYETNCTATAHLYEACRTHGVRRVVFASSSSVYGGSTEVPFQEDAPADRPVSPYAATKRAGEMLAWTYWHLHGIATTCLRFFTVYGPRQRPEMAIHRFIDAIERGQVLHRYGDGSSARDYTYVDDIVDGILRAIARVEGHTIVNLGGSDPVRLDALIAAIERATGRRARVEAMPDQPGDVPITCADVTRAQQWLGWRPTTSLDEGLARMVAWYRAERAG